MVAGFESVHPDVLGSVRIFLNRRSGAEGYQFTQTDIGERIHKSLDAMIQKQSHDPEMSGEATPYFRLSPDRKVRVRALAANNPKQFEEVKTYYALFKGDVRR